MDLELIKQQLIDTGIFNKGGYYNPKYILPSYIDLSEIEGDSLKEKVWVIFKNNGVHPHCPVCGKPSRFVSYSRGCYVCCSNDCKKILDSEHCRANNKRRHEDAEYVKPIVEKAKKTFKERYGVYGPSNIPEIREKIVKTSLERYGVDNPFKSKKVQENIKETWQKKYGYDNPSKVPSIKKKILSHRGMTIPEKKMDEFLTSRGFEYQYGYECNGKNFDFAIFKDGELSILIEIDGEYYHAINSDPDGFHSQGFNDEERFSKVPDDVKFINVDSKRVEDAFAEILRVFNIDYEEWIQEIIESLPYDFPYYEYDENRMRNDYKRLCNAKTYKPGARLADSTIKNFHKSIYHARVGNSPSPFEAWYDEKLIDKCVRNRFIYSSNLSSHAILNGFNVCKIAPKVSVFSASLARYLTETYLSEFDTIFDPFSGFSGRLLGVCSLGKKYIGQDINQTHINESNEIIYFLNLNAEVICKDIFNSEGEYDCLFTCSPYNNKESWNDNDLNLSCDEWIDICLERFKCKKYLFVVDNVKKYKDYIVEEIGNKSHFSKAKEYVVLI